MEKTLLAGNSDGQVRSDGQFVWLEMRSGPDLDIDWFDLGYVPVEKIDNALALLRQAKLRIVSAGGIASLCAGGSG